MPAHRVSTRASDLIARGKRAGKTSREIARELKKRLGIELDQSTITRHAQKIGGDAVGPRGKRKPPPPSPVRVAEEEPPVGAAAGWEAPDREVLSDEVAALRREVDNIQRILGLDLPPRDRVALTAELRAGFKSIRQVEAARRDAKKNEVEDVTRIVDRLKRFAADNHENFGEPALDDDEVPAGGHSSRSA